MKKIVALILAVLMVVSLLAGTLLTILSMV